MKRWLTASVISLLWAIIALSPAARFAQAIERLWYPDDPDPVDFTVGGIFFAAWLSLWLLVTVALAIWAARSRQVA